MKYTNLLERFLGYVKVNTRSDENSQSIPSTKSQEDFAKNILWPQMEAVGLEDIHYLSNGYIVGTLRANAKAKKKIGFLAHMDTADFNAENIRPQVIENYNGQIISLGDGEYVLDPVEFPNLKKYLGKTLITTDGHTLLGADDKAGIAEIMTAMEYFHQHPEVLHGEIRVGFGPDEEIGTGADHFDVKDFNVDFAYTMDGGPLGELEYETFSAASADITFLGRNVHPGTAKNQMVNAIELAMQFHRQLPEEEKPEHTEGYEGFFHLMEIAGNVEEARSSYIIRDFEDKKFASRKTLVEEIARRMNEELGTERVKVQMRDQYHNMKKVIEKDMCCVDLAKKAMEALNIEPIIQPVRGGTDGSKISFMGIPTPNIFAGGENMHGRYEFACLETMESAIDVIIEIARSLVI
ncbi:peptidase T [Lachnospiraceae bacterium oral taxon 096]|jgi:peptidase T|nr:peptidase T [Lachnospiraceae bacterium oral taxon 096]QUI96406.1 peptidase T [Lachnospiraceae bacterium oral taxon 096]